MAYNKKINENADFSKLLMDAAIEHMQDQANVYGELDMSEDKAEVDEDWPTRVQIRICMIINILTRPGCVVKMVFQWGTLNGTDSKKSTSSIKWIKNLMTLTK